MLPSAALLVVPSETGVLANDPGTYTRRVELIEDDGPAFGTLNLNADGSFIYDPPVGFIGTDFFSYVVIDENSGNTSMPISVEIHVGPHANPDFYAIDAGNPLDVAAQGVLLNDVGWGEADLVTPPGQHVGTFTLNADGSFDYVPVTAFSGTDYFEYRVFDPVSNEYSPTTTVTIEVVQPIATADTYTIARGTGPLRVNRPGVLANDHDASIVDDSFGWVTGFAHGSMDLNADGSFAYTPPSGFAGIAKYEYRVQNLLTSAYSPPAIITIEITAPPDAVDDNYTVDVNSFIQVAEPGILQNDSRAASFQLFSIPQHGTLSNYNTFTREFRYTPASGYYGPDSFQYRATNQYGHSELATVHLEVRMDPVAAPDSYLMALGATLSVAAPGVLGNDTYADSAELIAPPNPSHGTLTFNSNGSFSFAAASTYYGVTTFQYRARHLATNGSSALATVTINVIQPNAIADSYFVARNEIAFIDEAQGVLANDFLGDVAERIVGSGPTHGSLVFNTDGTFYYTPNSGYIGTDVFQYRAKQLSTGLLSSPTTVTIQVVHRPQANPDNYTLPLYSDTLTIPASGVLLNDQYANSAELVPYELPSGALQFNSDGSFSFTPTYWHVGNMSFHYIAINTATGLRSNPATIIVNVIGPETVPDEYVVGMNGSLAVTSPGVLANDRRGGFAWGPNSGPLHGWLEWNYVSNQQYGDGGFTYHPFPWYTGDDSFVYAAGALLSGTGNINVASPVTVTIHVEPRPWAVADDYSVSTIETLQFASDDIVANDYCTSDMEIVPGSGPYYGTLSFDNGNFTYVPSVDYAVVDAFQYVAVDAAGHRSAPVAVTIHLIDDHPHAHGDWFQMIMNTTLETTTPGVLVNDVNAHEVILLSGPSNGSLTLNTDGSFVYVPDPEFEGDDTFQYVARLITGEESSPATVTIHVYDDSPEAVDDSYWLLVGQTLEVFASGILANDSFANTVLLISGPNYGSLALNDDGSFVYIADPSFLGTVTFTYKAKNLDTGEESAEATVTIEITEL